MTDLELLDKLQFELDKIEKTVSMRGPFGRVPPYIVEQEQFGHRFRLAIFFREAASWYDNSNPDWSLMFLRKENWIRHGDIVFESERRD